MVSAIATKFSSTTADWQQAWARYRPFRASAAPASRPTPIPSSMMRVASELQGAAVPKNPLLTIVVPFLDSNRMISAYPRPTDQPVVVETAGFEITTDRNALSVLRINRVPIFQTRSFFCRDVRNRYAAGLRPLDNVRSSAATGRTHPRLAGSCIDSIALLLAFDCRKT
jgi:hypothetical protein